MKRMTWHKELRWLLAAKMIAWSLALVEREANGETLEAYADLCEKFANDGEHDTVQMRTID